MQRSCPLLVIALALISSLQTLGCDEPVLPPSTPRDDFDEVARAIAHALESRDLRDTLIANMAKSTYPNHVLLFSELGDTSSWSPAIVTSIEGHLGTNVDALDRLPANDTVITILVVTSALDRATWDGNADVLVLTLSDTILREESLPNRGFYTDGTVMTAPLAFVEYELPVLTVRAVPASFLDPDTTEAIGRVDMRPDGRTISSFEEEFWFPLSADRSSTATPDTLPSTKSFRDCTENVPDTLDLDGDLLDDECEFELARTFAPHMIFDSADLVFDSSVPPRRLGDHEVFWEARRPLQNEELIMPFAVTEGDLKDEVWIFFAVAYYRDGGTGSDFWDNFGGPHPGDSEFIVMSVTYSDSSDSEGWVFSRYCLSAHWGKWPVDSSKCYKSSTGRVPPVWVARWKHANYATQAKCESGAAGVDQCASPRLDTVVVATFPGEDVYRWKIGVRDTAYRHYNSDSTAFERLWNRQNFCGWLGLSDRSECAGSYDKRLRFFRFDRQLRND